MTAAEVAELVLRERQSRDRGRWDRLGACYAPDSAVRLSWFRGTGEEFVARSREMRGRGDLTRHRLGPPVVDLDGDRAIAEMSAAIELRTVLDGVEIDLTSYTRLLYRAEVRSGRWLITSMDPIYERDVLAPVLPGTPLPLPSLEGLRPSYRFLAHVFDRRGYPIADDLYGDDRPAEVAELYDSLFAWLSGKAS
ncbi:nuclear transport factor 2 family protein [Amycolatopsis sp. NPDC048633]|uniref:nuclear transport factor 2 family protein n=1 Tax=Amycolatopsis sp. NPDC048633 TaxID=3157095 RepID=UPI0033ED2692